MSARSQALVPLSTEQQAAWRAVAETEKRRHQGNLLAEYPYAGAFFRCLNGSRRISLSDLRFFMPSLTAEELHGNRLQWLYAIDVLIETQGEVCLLPLTLVDIRLFRPALRQQQVTGVTTNQCVQRCVFVHD